MDVDDSWGLCVDTDLLPSVCLPSIMYCFLLDVAVQLY